MIYDLHWNLHIADIFETNFDVRRRERCPLHGGIIICHTVFWDKNICSLLGGVRCIKVFVNGGLNFTLTVVPVRQWRKQSPEMSRLHSCKPEKGFHVKVIFEDSLVFP